MSRNATVGSLGIDLDASSAKFAADMGKAQKAVTSNAARMNKSLARLDRGFGKARAGVARYAKSIVSMRGAVATLAGSAGLGLLVKRSLDFADAIDVQSKVLGFSIKQLQELRFAADRSGVATTLLESSLTAFVKRMGEARAGIGPMVSGLKTLDGELLAQVLATRNMDEALNVLIRGMGNASTAADRARIANAAFSRSGIALVNLAENGADGFDKMRQMANSLGVVIRDDLIRSAAEANDKLAILGTVLSTKVTAAVLELAPAIADLSQRFIDGLPTLVKYVEKLGRLFGLIEQSPAQRVAELNAELAKLADQLKEPGISTPPTGENISRRDAIRFLMQEAVRERKKLLANMAATEREFQQRLQGTADLSGQTTVPAGGQARARPTGPTARARPRLKPPTIDIIADRNLKPINALMERFRKDRENAVAAQRKLAAAAAQVFADTRLPMEDYQARLIGLNDLVAKGAIDQMTYARAVAQAQDNLSQAAIAGNRFAAAGVEMGRSLSTAMEGVILRANSAKDAMRGLLLEVQRLVLQAAVTGPLQDLLGGALSGLFAGSSGPTASSIKKLKGFAHGGSFTVGGGGGTDSTLVQFAATRGENVTVTPPGRAANGGTQVVYNIDARGSEAGVERRIMAALNQLHGSIEGRAVSAVRDARARNPALFGGAGA